MTDKITLISDRSNLKGKYHYVDALGNPLCIGKPTYPLVWEISEHYLSENMRNNWLCKKCQKLRLT